MTEQRRWGKAGVSLTPEQARRVAGRKRLHSGRDAAATVEDNAIAHQRWAAGMVVPHNISTALDAMGLEGPEVDAECGVREPAVDLWEAGKLYPTWDQLVRLAALTGCTPRFFTVAGRALGPLDTSMHFHVKRGDVPSAREQPVMRYPDDVVRRCPGTGEPAPGPRAGA